MGHDVWNICRHNLDTSSHEALAKDIANRFKVNVRLTYQDYYGDYFEERESTYDFITIGEIITEGATETYVLRDEQHQVKEYYRQHGDKLFELILNKNHLKVEEYRDMLTRDYYDLTTDVENEERFNIYKDTLDIMSAEFGGRWWSFCKVFTVKNDFDKEYEWINQYRKKIRDDLKKYGGNEVYYLDDQGDTQYLIYGEYSWQELTSEINTKFQGDTLKVSDFMRHPQPWPEDKYPLAFYDDFSDL